MPVYLTPSAISSLCLALFYGITVGYLLSRRDRSRSTWWLIGFSGFYLLTLCCWLLVNHSPPLWRDSRILALAFAGGVGFNLPAQWCFVQYAYTFKGNPFTREARVVGLVMGLLAVTVPVATLLDSEGLVYLAYSLGNLTFSSWAAVVFIRKGLRFAREETGAELRWHDVLRRPVDRRTRGCRAFAGLALVVWIMSLAGLMVWYVQLAPMLFLVVFMLGNLLMIYGIALTYVAYAPEATTVQVKLVGTTLVLVLTLIGFAATLLFPTDRMIRESRVLDRVPHTLLVEPHAGGGYRAARAPLVLHTEGNGRRLALGDEGETPVALPFAFPFQGASYDTLYVHANGIVGLGGSAQAQPIYDPAVILAGAPVLFPLYADLDPGKGGAVTVRTQPETAVVTWETVPVHLGEAVHTAQLALHTDGRMALSWVPPDDPEAWHGGTMAGLPVRGFHPGDAGGAQLVAWNGGGTQHVPSGAALVDDMSLRYRQYAATRGQPLLWLTLGAVAFVLLVFPVLFRTSLLRPLAELLDGVKRVNQGDLDVVVPVHGHDELGTLGRHFNQMTASVRAAEEQLRDYARTLEERVDERTAALQESLAHLKATQAQLVQQEKLASLGQLTAGIAHEIKNPLNFVNNFSELIVELSEELTDVLGPHLGASIKDDADDFRILLADIGTNAALVNKHGKRADAIVRAMMQHARGGKGQRGTVDLNAFVDEYVDLAWHGRRAQEVDFSVEIVRDYGDGVGTVDMVPQEIGRVVLNLLGNAFDASEERRAKGEEGSTGTGASGTRRGVQLNAQPTDQPTVTVTTRRLADAVEIRIADNGPGIPEDLRDKIFEPFFTTKPAGRGTGLGLSLSYDIVTQGHGGTMTVESTPGAGATFILTLPA